MYLYNHSPDEEIGILTQSKLLYWTIPIVCIKNQWWQIDFGHYCKTFAWAWLESHPKTENEKILLLADGLSYYTEADVLKDVKVLADQENINFDTAESMWIYARLMAIKTSKQTDDIRFQELQDVIEDVIISPHAYPNIFRSCDQYYPSDVPPFFAMNRTIDILYNVLKKFQR